MTVERRRYAGPVVFTCDICGEECETHSSDFESALAKAKVHGFRAVKVEGEWEHRCRDCVE